MTDEWEELFARAEGRLPTVDARPEAAVQEINPATKSFLDFLEDRSTSDTWDLSSSSVFVLGMCIVDVSCRKWKHDGTQNNKGLCSCCRCPMFFHALIYNQPDHIEPPTSSNPFASVQIIQEAFPVFCAIRNLRCAAKIVALSTQQQQPWTIDTSFLKEEARKLRPYQFGPSIVAPHQARSLYEIEPLKTKLVDVQRLAQPFCGQQPRQVDRQGGGHFEMAVRLMIGCDLTYYQLYYLHLDETLGGINGEFLPHPVGYFAAMTSGDLEPAVQAIADMSLDEHICNLFGVNLKPEDEHVLSSLHHYRWAESFHLFGPVMSWWATNGNHNRNVQMLWPSFFVPNFKHKERFKLSEEAHETAAPLLLQDWRDSCRDFLCHLYAYATVSSNVIRKLIQLLQKLDVDRIIDMGAGTGYLALLLEKEGVQVDAFDSVPTAEDSRTANEYHGVTPPFHFVERVSSHVRSSRSCENRALVLCYPPSDSSMALTTIRDFVKRSGRILVNIGECQGLTGSREFEAYVQQNMILVDRFPCLTWGTDASEITVWKLEGKKRQAPDSVINLMLPCSFCGKKRAIKRCRLFRLLCYCSKECCDSHSKPRGNYFRMSLIDMESSKLDFNDDMFFQALRK